MDEIPTGTTSVSQSGSGSYKGVLRAPELKPQHQTVFSVILRTLIGERVFPSADV